MGDGAMCHYCRRYNCICESEEPAEPKAADGVSQVELCSLCGHSRDCHNDGFDGCTAVVDANDTRQCICGRFRPKPSAEQSVHYVSDRSYPECTESCPVCGAVRKPGDPCASCGEKPSAGQAARKGAELFVEEALSKAAVTGKMDELVDAVARGRVPDQAPVDGGRGDVLWIAFDAFNNPYAVAPKPELIAIPRERCKPYVPAPIPVSPDHYKPRDWSQPHLQALNYLNNCLMDEEEVSLDRLHEILDVPDAKPSSPDPRVEEIRGRWQMATQGPWEVEREPQYGNIYVKEEKGNRGRVCRIWDGRTCTEENSEAIAAAPDDIRYLLDRNAALEAELDRLKNLERR